MEQGCIAEEFVYNAASVPVKEEEQPAQGAPANDDQQIELDKEYENGKEVTENTELSLFEAAQIKALDAFVESDQLIVYENGDMALCAVNEKVDEAKKAAVKQVKQAVMDTFKEKGSKLKVEQWNVFGSLAFMNGKSRTIAISVTKRARAILYSALAGAAADIASVVIPVAGALAAPGIALGTSIAIRYKDGDDLEKFIKENKALIQKNLDKTVEDYEVSFKINTACATIMIFTFKKKAKADKKEEKK